MRDYLWWPLREGPGSGTGQVHFNYQLCTLFPGDTFIRSLMWIKANIQKDGVADPQWGFGPAQMMGVSVSDSVVAPELDALFDWTHTGPPYRWLWQYWPTGGSWSSLPEAGDVPVSDMMNMRDFQQIRTQHKNVSGADEYIWFQWSLDPDIYGESQNTCSFASKTLTLQAAVP